MNAPPNIDPVTAHSDSDVVHWLTNDTRDERFIDNIFAELCVRLQRAGIPVKRASLHVLIYHPQWLGARIMWAEGMREAELARVDYDVRERSEYIDRTVPPRCARISNAIPRLVASTPSMTRCGQKA
jgi:adenylate cyclase